MGKDIFIGIFGLLVLVVMASGCTSNVSSGSDVSDLELVNEPQISEFAPGEWGVMASIKSKTNTSYSSVIANVTAYGADNKVIASRGVSLQHFTGGSSQIGAIFNSDKKIDHATIRITNATPM